MYEVKGWSAQDIHTAILAKQLHEISMWRVVDDSPRSRSRRQGFNELVGRQVDLAIDMTRHDETISHGLRLKVDGVRLPDVMIDCYGILRYQSDGSDKLQKARFGLFSAPTLPDDADDEDYSYFLFIWPAWQGKGWLAATVESGTHKMTVCIAGLDERLSREVIIKSILPATVGMHFGA